MVTRVDKWPTRQYNWAVVAWTVCWARIDIGRIASGRVASSRKSICYSGSSNFIIFPARTTTQGENFITRMMMT